MRTTELARASAEAKRILQEETCLTADTTKRLTKAVTVMDRLMNRRYAKEAPNKWPRISVITPTYNQGEFIEQTIKSVLDQRYPNLEYIVMDGGSTDNTLEIVDKYLDRIDIFKSEKDKGQSNAINKGMNQSTGEILYWLNSDDILEEGVLYYVGASFLKDDWDILSGCCTPFDNETKRLLNRHIATCPFGIRTEDITDIQSTWLKGMYFHQPEVFFSRRIWDAAGGHVDESLFYSMDYDLWVRMAIAAGGHLKLSRAGKSFCLFRHHKNQKTSTTEAYLPELLNHSENLRHHTPSKNLKDSFSIAREFRGRLSIVAISDYGFNGGAGAAHKRVCQVLQAAGHDVIQLTGFTLWQSESLDISIEPFKEAVRAMEPDLVILGNLHNLARGLELAEFCAHHFPTVAIAHDFWWITGRCAYTHGCEYLKTKCSETCPTQNEYPRVDASRIKSYHERKQNLFRLANFSLLANSDYTYRAIAEALIAWGFSIKSLSRIALPVLPEGPTKFKPFSLDTRDKRMPLYGDDKTRILLGCTDHADYRKGADLAIEALRQLLYDDPSIEIGIYGRNSEIISERLDLFGDRIETHGYIADKEHMQAIFESADIFLGSSREETLGQTFIEAAHAGLITVGLASTGYQDTVDACTYSFSYPSSEPISIYKALLKALKVLKSNDRQQVRLIQKVQAEAAFAGMKFLSDFNNFLYQSGLWMNLKYHGPTKIFNLDYTAIDVNEIVLTANRLNSATGDTLDEFDASSIETGQSLDIGVNTLRLTKELYMESAEGKDLLWLKQSCSFMIPLRQRCKFRSIDLVCHWIPETMHSSEVILDAIGIGRFKGEVPKASSGAIRLQSIELQSSVHLAERLLLVKLQFESSHTLDDGRHQMALVLERVGLCC